MGLRKWTNRQARNFALRCAPIRLGRPHTLPGKLVVSLTSHPPRYSTLDLTLRRLLSQDMRPDAIALWIAHQDRAALPRRVTRLERYGLTIRECEDLRQYNKIIPALKSYSDAFILTADDDLNYPRDWLRRFVEAYRSPREVLCQCSRRMVRNGAGYAPYRQWNFIDSDGMTGPEVFLMGADGALYPPGVLPPQTTDSEQFMRLCPSADDIWLHWMASLSGATVRFVKPSSGKAPNWPGSQRVALWKTNVTGGSNDEQIAAMVAAYGMPQQMP